MVLDQLESRVPAAWGKPLVGKRVEGLEIWQMMFAAAVAIGVGSFGAFASLDLDPFMGFFLCAMYFVATVLLRVVMDLPAVPGLISD